MMTDEVRAAALQVVLLRARQQVAEVEVLQADRSRLESDNAFLREQLAALKGRVMELDKSAQLALATQVGHECWHACWG